MPEPRRVIDPSAPDPAAPHSSAPDAVAPDAPDPTYVDPAEIITFDDIDDPDLWAKPSLRAEIAVVEPDETWPEQYAQLAATIRTALGETVLALQHIGSTSVPGLTAKPVIDIDLLVPDPRDEDAYRPALEEVGFDLVIREPNWFEHRVFRHQLPDGQQREPLCNLHVFGPHCAEFARHRLFRDWLREHPVDRDRYAAAKHLAAAESNAVGETVMEYNARKEAVIRDIYDRIFTAAGWR